LGKDFTVSELKEQGYEALFLAVGAPRGLALGLEGESAAGCDEAIGFLRRNNLNGKGKVSGEVVVVGGGNAAVDAARSALRLGAETVTVVYRRTRAEMPAYEEEVEEAEKEGVRFRFLAAPVRLAANRGKPAELHLQPMELGEFDKSGRRRPEASRDGEYTLPADLLIAAIGQSLEPEELFDGVRLKLNDRGYIAADPTSGQTSEPWIFAGGDAVYGPSSVIEAVAAGEKAAVGINRFLGGKTEAFWRKDHGVDTFFDPEADPVETPRAEPKLISVGKRRGNFTEVENTWSRSVALAEAKRCLRCDYREPESGE
jgi:NADH-quinone oxidoreductase subunit F